MVRIVINYGGSKILRIWAPYYFDYGRVIWVVYVERLFRVESFYFFRSLGRPRGRQDDNTGVEAQSGVSCPSKDGGEPFALEGDV